jgi:multidrug efflux pump subunit AcrB
VISIATYPGASPRKVENTVTKKIEDDFVFRKHKKIDSKFESLSSLWLLP